MKTQNALIIFILGSLAAYFIFAHFHSKQPIILESGTHYEITIPLNDPQNELDIICTDKYGNMERYTVPATVPPGLSDEEIYNYYVTVVERFCDAILSTTEYPSDIGELDNSK